MITIRRRTTFLITLPIVSLFNPSYIKWRTRRATLQEVIASGGAVQDVKTGLEAVVCTARGAAVHVARSGTDPGLVRFIDDVLQGSANYRSWQSAMPARTPAALVRYQKYYPRCDLSRTTKDISAVGATLQDGQHLFHAGAWPGGRVLVTSRPLSASLCLEMCPVHAHCGAEPSCSPQACSWSKWTAGSTGRR